VRTRARARGGARQRRARALRVRGWWCVAVGRMRDLERRMHVVAGSVGAAASRCSARCITQRQADAVWPSPCAALTWSGTRVNAARGLSTPCRACGCVGGGGGRDAVCARLCEGASRALCARTVLFSTPHAPPHATPRTTTRARTTPTASHTRTGTRTRRRKSRAPATARAALTARTATSRRAPRAALGRRRARRRRRPATTRCVRAACVPGRAGVCACVVVCRAARANGPSGVAARRAPVPGSHPLPGCAALTRHARSRRGAARTAGGVDDGHVGGGRRGARGGAADGGDGGHGHAGQHRGGGGRGEEEGKGRGQEKGGRRLRGVRGGWRCVHGVCVGGGAGAGAVFVSCPTRPTTPPHHHTPRPPPRRAAQAKEEAERRAAEAAVQRAALEAGEKMEPSAAEAVLRALLVEAGGSADKVRCARARACRCRGWVRARVCRCRGRPPTGGRRWRHTATTTTRERGTCRVADALAHHTHTVLPASVWRRQCVMCVSARRPRACACMRLAAARCVWAVRACGGASPSPRLQRSWAPTHAPLPPPPKHSWTPTHAPTRWPRRAC
jgi:hypothetical protein